MTLKEFHKQELAIQNEKFESSSEGFTHRIERAIFEQRQLKKLIEVARQVPFKTGRDKLAVWERQLERALRRQARFEEMREKRRVQSSLVALTGAKR